LSVVLSHQEALAVIGRLAPPYDLLASLMYGAGLRVVEAARLWVKDVDFDKQVIIVRDGKGGKDRTTLLPASLTARLTERIALIRGRRQAREAFYQVPVTVPHPLKRKYPSASGSLQWQWLFPSAGVCMDADGDPSRHHVHVSSIQRAVKQAVQACGLGKPANSHTFRHTLATELLRRGSDIRTVQTLLGHADVRTTQIYTHVLGQAFAGVRSPLG